MALTKEQILAANDSVVEEVEIPEWSGSVKVRGMTGKDRDAFEASLMEKKGKSTEQNFANLRAKLVSRTVVDDEGNLIFSEADIPAIGEKSAKAIDRIFKVAQRLSGIGQDAVDELTKN